ncbi:MAG TPA: DUF3307 domain-containing protein [Salinimicrobium sp.]|nr:DUF3307 domain-containing protein [Salinimicrobium sp.]
MTLLIKFILAHLIGDFLLQPTSWVKEKEIKKAASFKIYLHVLIHAGLLFLLTWDLNLWLPIVIIAFSHFIIDLLKLYFQNAETRRRWFFVDQILHLTVLVIVFCVLEKPSLNLEILFTEANLLFLAGLVFLSFPAAVVMRMLLIKLASNIPDGQDESLSNAGTYIGILERLLVFVFIIINHWEAVGFLIAAKSIFRFGDLKESKDRKLTEYILIGTFLSFGIAIFCGLLIKTLLV